MRLTVGSFFGGGSGNLTERRDLILLIISFMRNYFFLFNRTTVIAIIKITINKTGDMNNPILLK